MTIYTDNTNGGVDIDLNPDDKQTKWLLAEGYVGLKKPTKKDEDRGRYMTSPPASDDPTLAINRESPTPVDKLKPHIANDDVDTDAGVTTLGANAGLEAKPVGNVDQAPKVKFTSHAKAGEIPAIDDTAETSSLKEAIDKEQGQPKPFQPKETAPEESDLKKAIDKEQPAVTTPVPGA
jgi:hypothetical protein